MFKKPTWISKINGANDSVAGENAKYILLPTMRTSHEKTIETIIPRIQLARYFAKILVKTRAIVATTAIAK